MVLPIRAAADLRLRSDGHPAAGTPGLSRKSTRPFQAVAPIIAMSVLAVGGFLVENTEVLLLLFSWRSR